MFNTILSNGRRSDTSLVLGLILAGLLGCKSNVSGEGSSTIGSSGSGVRGGSAATESTGASGGVSSGGLLGGQSASTGGRASSGGSASAESSTATGGASAGSIGVSVGGSSSSGGSSGTGGGASATSRTSLGTSTGGGSGGGSFMGGTGGGSTGNSGGSSGADAGAGGSKLASYRIMPFGDSITVTMCPPQLLEQKLKANGFSNFSFVGSKLCNQSCNGAPNTQCEGQGGIWATNLVPGGANPELLTQWTTGSQYDVVLMHLGTNDCWSPGAVPDLQKVIDAFSVILEKLRVANPKVIVFVAQIIPLNPANCATCETRVQQLNALIPAWAAGKSTAQSPVYVANLHAAFDGLSFAPNSANSNDGAHPTAAGSQLMADAWYAALRAHGIP